MKPLVSVCCITFNHRDLIRDALDGFLAQETNFDFEILIYDDASTDGTDEILKSYEKKHPNKLRVFYQKDNQYSKGIRGLNVIYNFPRVTGKYIALCEGDDYWSDVHKLQKQVDFLESHSDFTAAVHSVSIDRLLTEVNYHYNYEFENDFDLSMREILKKGGSVYPTCSLLARTEVLKKIDFSQHAIAGDFVIIVHLNLFGNIRFMAEKMGCYRIHEGGVHQSQAIKKSHILKNRFEIMLFYYQLFKKFPLKYIPLLAYRSTLVLVQYGYLSLKFIR